MQVSRPFPWIAPLAPAPAAPSAPVANIGDTGVFGSRDGKAGQATPHPALVPPDPDRPTGPPPAFDVTPLEAQRERLRATTALWQDMTAPAPRRLDIGV